jgi:hypothetical protein
MVRKAVKLVVDDGVWREFRKLALDRNQSIAELFTAYILKEVNAHGGPEGGSDRRANRKRKPA